MIPMRPMELEDNKTGIWARRAHTDQWLEYEMGDWVKVGEVIREVNFRPEGCNMGYTPYDRWEVIDYGAIWEPDV